MRIVFISTMTGYPWGGSEELWSQTALRLAQAGHHVSALTEKAEPVSPKLLVLQNNGVDVRLRQPPVRTYKDKILGKLTGKLPKNPDVTWLETKKPELVVISQGGMSDGWHWMKFCQEQQLPYAVIVQSNADTVWVRDEQVGEMAASYRTAQSVYSVSQHNLRLLEWQIGEKLPNGHIVWNPNNAADLKLLPWPQEKGKLSLACVARLEPAAKSQDVLFQVLAQTHWRERPVELNLYGSGPYEKVLRNLAQRLELNNVHFRGYVTDIGEIWRKNHLLILPSRHEGMPLSLIEAMSCGRPAIVTNVGGNAELCVDGESGFVASAAAVGPLDEALNRAWARRTEWEQMGRAARIRIGQIVPTDPVGDFCELLVEPAVEPTQQVLS